MKKKTETILQPGITNSISIYNNILILGPVNSFWFVRFDGTGQGY